MKLLFKSLAGLCLLGSVCLAVEPTGPGPVKYYKSTMMPGQISDQPAKDSMGMEMVPVYEGDDASGPTIKIEAGTLQQMNLKTALVTRGPVRRAIRSLGEVGYDERGLHDIATKYDGKALRQCRLDRGQGRRSAFRDLLAGALQRPTELPHRPAH